jgi:hypothetical protein
MNRNSSFNFCNCQSYNPNCIYCVTYKRNMNGSRIVSGNNISNNQNMVRNDNYRDFVSGRSQRDQDLNGYRDETRIPTYGIHSPFAHTRVMSNNHIQTPSRIPVTNQNVYQSPGLLASEMLGAPTNRCSAAPSFGTKREWGRIRDPEQRYNNQRNWKQNAPSYSDDSPDTGSGEEEEGEEEEDDELPYYTSECDTPPSLRKSSSLSLREDGSPIRDSEQTKFVRENDSRFYAPQKGKRENQVSYNDRRLEENTRELYRLSASDIEKERSKMEIDSSNQRYLKSKDKSFIEVNTRDYDDDDVYDCVQVEDKYKNYNYKKSADELTKERNFL